MSNTKPLTEMTTKEALALLFRPSDYVASPNEPILFSELNEYDELFSVNPLDGAIDHNPTKPYHARNKPRRADLNVSSYPNAIFEDDSTPVEVQREQIAKIAHLVRLAVFSGNKSVSLIVSCADTLPFTPHSEAGLHDYKLAWRGLARHIESLTCLKLDPSTQNCSRLTRTPNATRSSNGQTQEILHVGPLVTSDFILSHMFTGEKSKNTYAPVDIHSFKEFESLLKNERVYAPLRNKLQSAAIWAKPTYMYREILKLTLWAIDATQVPQEIMREYLWKYTFPALLAVGYDQRKIEEGLVNAYRYKGLSR